MSDPADLVQRLRARAATVSANGARDTGELLLEAAEVLEAFTVRTQRADQDIAIREILAEQEDADRLWFGNNIRAAWRTLRAYRSLTPEQRD